MIVAFIPSSDARMVGVPSVPGSTPITPPPLPTPTPKPPPSTTPTTTEAQNQITAPSYADGNTAFQEISEYSGSTLSEIGDLAKLHEDYIHVNFGDPSQSYIKTEVSGVSIVDYKRDGVIGASADGNLLYKYRLTSEFYTLVYTAYPSSYFYSLTPKTVKEEWCSVDRAGAMSWGSIWETYSYNIEFKDYSSSGAATKRNGGEYEIPLTVSFELPLAGEKIGDYQIMNLKSSVVSLQTSSESAEIGKISSTDARYNSGSQSGKATGYTKKNSVTGIEYGDMDKSDLESEISRTNPGWSSEGTAKKVSDNVMNVVSMGTNSRLASGSASSLTGTYKCNVGAHAYHYQSDINIKWVKFRIDTRGPWTGAAAMDVRNKKIARTQGFGVDNNYVKQKQRAVFEIVCELSQLDAEITANELLQSDNPEANETINFDNQITGDMDAEIQANESFFSSSEFKWILIGVGGFILIAVVVVVMIRLRIL